MSKSTKWVWTIVIVLIVVVLGAAAFSAGSWFGTGGMMGDSFYRDRDAYHMLPFDRFALGFRSPLGWLGMGLGMLLMWGLPLGILILAIVGVVSLVRGSSTAQTANPAAPVAAPSPTAAPLVSAATTVLRECEGCGKPAQADWKVCPYCGSPLSE